MWPASSVQFNGINIPFLENDDDDFTTDFWTYDVSALTVLINIATPAAMTQLATAKVAFANSLQDPVLASGFQRKLARLQECKDLLDDEWGTYLNYAFTFTSFITPHSPHKSFLLNYLTIDRYYPSDYPNLLIAAGSGLNMTVSTVYHGLNSFSSLFLSAISEVNALSSTNEQAVCLQFLNSA